MRAKIFNYNVIEVMARCKLLDNIQVCMLFKICSNKRKEKKLKCVIQVMYKSYQRKLLVEPHIF